MNIRTSHEREFASFLCEQTIMNNKKNNATFSLVDGANKAMNVQQLAWLSAYEFNQNQSVIVSVI